MPHKDPEARRKYCREYGRRYRQKNLDKMRAYKNAWRAKNADVEAERQRRYRQEHPEKFAAYTAHRRAVQAEAPQGDVTLAAEFIEILRRGICELCGRSCRIHVDHIEPLSTGGEHGWENFAGLCQSCNSSKGTRPLLVGMLV